MSAATTEALYKALRTQILDFVAEGSPTPDTLATSLTGQGIYAVQGPDEVTYPYGVMRLQNRRTSGEYNGERETVDLELLLFHRPRNEQYPLEGLADIADEAMLRYVDNSAGLVFSRERQRDTLPAGTGPADREVVAIRCLYPLTIWPQYLTQYAD